MYYEIYIDVLFLSNFFLDYLLLLFVWRVLACPGRRGRVLLGAVVGAAMTCVVVLIPFPILIVKLALFHVVINTLMIKIAFRITNRTLFWEACGLLYVSAFLMGGILRFLGPDVNWFAVMISYFLMKGIFFFVKRLQRNLKCKCRVVLYTSTGTYELQALLDTGNELVDKVSGKGVSVVDVALAKRMFSDEEMNTVRYVPFRSIGKAGVLPAVKIRSMTVEQEKQEYEIESPVIGISERDISTKASYQIILNPDILGGMRHVSESSCTKSVSAEGGTEF